MDRQSRRLRAIAAQVTNRRAGFGIVERDAQSHPFGAFDDVDDSTRPMPNPSTRFRPVLDADANRFAGSQRFLDENADSFATEIERPSGEASPLSIRFGAFQRRGQYETNSMRSTRDEHGCQTLKSGSRKEAPPAANRTAIARRTEALTIARSAQYTALVGVSTADCAHVLTRVIDGRSVVAAKRLFVSRNERR